MPTGAGAEYPGFADQNVQPSERPFAEITEESFHLQYNVNALGAILTAQEAIKRFGADGGSIINLSSIVGSHPVPGDAVRVHEGRNRNADQDWRSNWHHAKSACIHSALRHMIDYHHKKASGADCASSPDE